MGGLFDGLTLARSTLSAAQAGVQLTGHNISNANTEGYHRQRLATSAIAPPANTASTLPRIGGGVQVDNILRAADPLLARRVAASLGGEAWASTRENLMLQVEQAVAELGEGGAGAAISDLMDKFSALSTSPSDMTVRREVLAAARNLADTFNRMAADLDLVVDGAHAEATATAESIGAKAAEIASLNSQIVEAEANGQQAANLRDRRDLLACDLASLAGTTSFETSYGQLTVLIGGMSLVQGNISSTLQVSQGTDGKSGVTLVSGGARVDVTASVTSGELGGLLSVQSTVVDDLMPQVDQLVYDIVTAVNTQHQLGVDLNGAAGGNLFTPLGLPVAGSAAAMSLDPTITPQGLAASSPWAVPAVPEPSNNDNALQLAALAGQFLAGGGTTTFSGEISAIVGHVGTLTDQVMQAAAVRKDELTYLQTLQHSSDGVSLDEEMIQLIEFQRSYQAGVKVLHVIDSLLEQVLKM